MAVFLKIVGLERVFLKEENDLPPDPVDKYGCKLLIANVRPMIQLPIPLPLPIPIPIENESDDSEIFQSEEGDFDDVDLDVDLDIFLDVD